MKIEDMFSQSVKQEGPEWAAKMCKVATSTFILAKIKRFRDSRVPHWFLESSTKQCHQQTQEDF